MAKADLTAEKLREILHYDTETGAFEWVSPMSNRVKAGDKVGMVNDSGYLIIGVLGTRWRAHHLAWMYVHGRLPINQLDHINGVRLDNRISNLREATDAQNRQNLGVSKKNTSGYMGVFWHKKSGKWMSQIRCGEKLTYLGLFETKEDAYASYLSAKKQIHTFNPVPRIELCGKHLSC